MPLQNTVTADVTDQVDGTAVDFVVDGGPFVSGSLVVEHNGLRLQSGEDFTEAVGLEGFTMTEAPLADDTLQVQFELEIPLVIASGTPPT